MMSAVLASRLIGYLREAYIAYAFGASHATDAFVTAFTIPDWLNYLVAGGSLSITFITIFSPYLADGREQEGYRVFSIIATFMALLLFCGIVVAEWFTPALLHLYVGAQFGPAEMAECIAMTRLLLPAQLFFCVGGLISAVLYARGSFLLPALAPLLYNTAIIAGGVALSRWLGIRALAVGALVGACLGPFLLPLAGAWRSGLRYRFSLALGHPQFRRWIALTLPLMVGVSLVTADDWIMRPLAAHTAGAISHLNYAKRLIGVPIAVLGQAVGQASMPFFAWLATEQRWDSFRETLDRSVMRTVAGAVLVTSWLMAVAGPVVRLVYQRGHFHPADARLTAIYFSVFLVTLACWSAQALYARAFYAAGDTFTPMAATTIITVASIALYIWLWHRMGIVGLAVASDIGISTQAVVLALLLRRRKLLIFSSRRWRHMPALLVLAALAGGASWAVVRWLAVYALGPWRMMALTVLASAEWLLLVLLLARALGQKQLLRESGRLMQRMAGRMGILMPRGEGGP